MSPQVLYQHDFRLTYDPDVSRESYGTLTVEHLRGDGLGYVQCIEETGRQLLDWFQLRTKWADYEQLEWMVSGPDGGVLSMPAAHADTATRWVCAAIAYEFFKGRFDFTT